MTRHHSCRVSPFGHPRIHARLAAPRGISQPPTSFIGSQCQGIHHAPLNTYNDNYYKPIWKNCTSTRQQQQHPHTPSEKGTWRRHGPLLARCSQPLSTNQTPHPTTKRGDNNHTQSPGRHPQQGRSPPPVPHNRAKRRCGLVVSKPNSVSDEISCRPAPPKEGTTRKASCLLCTRTPPHYRVRPIQRIA